MGEGIVHIFQAGREKKLIAKVGSLPDLAHGTPVAANGVLYITPPWRYSSRSSFPPRTL
jgi:hypothetical protein